MEGKPENLKEILQKGYAYVAKLPAKNDFLLTNGELDLQKLDSLDGYYIFMIAHDYDAKTPIMLNSLYEQLGFNLRSITIVINPENLEIVTQALKQDKKCFVGARGVGLKERIEYLISLFLKI